MEGTIYSRNTLGGAILDTSQNKDGLFYTPWEETDDKNLAQKYDFHFIRRYIIPYYKEGAKRGFKIPDSENNFCTKENEKCDINPHAFIIRTDGRAVNSPPPGFKTLSLINY